MDDLFKDVGGAILWIIAAFIVILACVVWYIFEYWYIFLGIPLIVFIIYYIVNYKEIKAECEAQMDEIERQMEEEKRLNKN